MNVPTKLGEDYSPVAVGLALALYAHNVPARVRAQKLCDHFPDRDLDMTEIWQTLHRESGFALMRFPVKVSAAYVRHALDQYGVEAAERVRQNMSVKF